MIRIGSQEKLDLGKTFLNSLNIPYLMLIEVKKIYKKNKNVFKN